MSALTDGAKKRLALHGPDRVLVDTNGQAVSQFRAKTEFGIDADVILIRADGWMLGAPWKLVNYARSIWKNEWAEEVIMNPDTRPKKEKPDAPKPEAPANPPAPATKPATKAPAAVAKPSPKPPVKPAEPPADPPKPS